MSIKDIQNQIIEEFSVFEDWMDKYEYLIELGKSVPIIKESDKTDSNIIKGCQSRVWLSVEYKDGKLFFKADSDAIITKGIISLLIRVYSEREPKEIIESDLFFLDEIGLKNNLSPTRANGLISMINQIRYYAVLYNKL